MISVVDAIREATQDIELAARISLLLRPSRLSELDDCESSIYGGEDNGKI